MTVLEFLNEYKWPIIAFYLIFISVLSVVVTVYDKIAAKRWQEFRTRERTLLILSALGGSLAMLITMLLIRHKTKHLKFMLGIPLIMAAQIAALAAGYIFLT